MLGVVVATLEFWFEFASTYSHPAAQRVEALAAQRGVTLAWRPFLLGPLFADLGWNDSPFNLQPAKGRYMWRDLERVCARQGVPFRRPSAFPRNGLLAARVATAAECESWLPDFVRAVYRANFAEDRDIADAAVLGEALERLGEPAEPWLARAAEPATRQRLRERVDLARERGIFGAPSFVVGGELFWGNDRLEEALDEAAG